MEICAGAGGRSLPSFKEPIQQQGLPRACGRPRRVQLLVLIDRGHRELPLEATFVGRNVQTTDREIIEVKLREIDDAEKVLLVEREG